MNINWEQKYKQLLKKHNDLLEENNDLLINQMKLDDMTGLLDMVNEKLNYELEIGIAFVQENMEYKKPFWNKNLRQLNSTIIKLYKLWNRDDELKMPDIIQFRPFRHKDEKITTQTLSRHVNNINNIVYFKSVGHQFFQRELQTALMKNWLADPMQDNYIIGPWNSENLQRVAGSSDHRWRQFKSMFHSLMGVTVFASRRESSEIRKWTRSKTANAFSLLLERGQKKGKLTEQHLTKTWAQELNDEITKCHVFFLNDLEAIAMCIDADINRNNFMIPQMIIQSMPKTIIDSVAGDKQSIYGYSEARASLTCMNQPMSAERSIPTVIICGNFADNYHTHAKIMHEMKSKFNYDKSYVIKALTSFPIVITLVLYYINSKSQCIESRLASSSVVIWSKTMKQECMAGIENYNEKLHAVCDDNVIQLKNKFKSNIMKLRNKKIQNVDKQFQHNKAKRAKFPKHIVPQSWQDAMSYVIIFKIL